jgi:hypothetical protein
MLTVALNISNSLESSSRPYVVLFGGDNVHYNSARDLTRTSIDRCSKNRDLDLGRGWLHCDGRK